MPIGCQSALTIVMDIFTPLRPTTILDVGIGSGVYGLLFREYTDIMEERYNKAEWQIRIDGVEIWDKYLTDSHYYWYDNLYITNILDFVPEIHYDFIYLGDIIEHLEKSEGLQLFEKMKTYSDNIIITTPIWFENQDHAPLGNKYELHKSHWSEYDFPGCQIIKTNPLIVFWSR